MSQHSDLRNALRELSLCGFLEGLTDIAHNVFVCQETIGWGALAEELASTLPGIFMPSRSGGITWICGANGPHGVIIEWQNLRKVFGARETMRNLIPRREDGKLSGWSIGSVCREFTGFIADAQDAEKTDNEFLSDIPFGYHCCIPGVYASPTPRTIPGGRMRNLFDTPNERLNEKWKAPVTLYDADSYYYNLLSRLPSVKVSNSGNNDFHFRGMSKWEHARFKDVIDCIADNKPVRNSLVGVMMGARNEHIAYTSSRPKMAREVQKKGMLPEHKTYMESRYKNWRKGDVRVINIPPKAGPFRGAAYLIVRSAYELCCIEALTGETVYGTIDSVALLSGKPTVWPKFGLPYSVKAQGDAEIVARGCYKIGPRETELYNDEFNRVPVPVARAPIPAHLYHRNWL